MQAAHHKNHFPIEVHVELHQKALAVAHEYLHFEAQLINVLQELDRAKTYLYFEQPSLFAYATKYLKLSEHVALTLIGIARKSNQVPELKAAIEEKKINVSNARRIMAVLTPENKTEWLEKAASLSQTKLDQELAKAFPEKSAPTKIKFKTEALVRLEIDVPNQVLELLKRSQEVLSQKNQKHIDLAQVLEATLAEYIERHDPVKKAERSRERQQERECVKKLNSSASQNMKKLHVLKQVCPKNFSGHRFTRVRSNAALKHAILLRDQNQCTHRYRDGSRCETRQWLDTHHLRPVVCGGANNLENLRTLCSGHHRMMHLPY